MPSRARRVKTATSTWAREARWSTLWRRWTMSPFTAKRRRANACRPSGPRRAPSITCAWRGPRPVRTAAVSPQPPARAAHPEFRGAGRNPPTGRKGGRREGGGRQGRCAFSDVVLGLPRASGGHRQLGPGVRPRVRPGLSARGPSGPRSPSLQDPGVRGGAAQTV